MANYHADQTLFDRLKKQRKIMIDARDEIKKIEYKMAEDLVKTGHIKLDGEYPPFSLWDVATPLGTFWDCEDSPFGICFYDEWMDPPHDNCIICGLPEERK